MNDLFYYLIMILFCLPYLTYIKRGLMDIKFERHHKELGYLYSEWINIRVAPQCNVEDENGQYWVDTYEMRMSVKKR